MLFKNIFSLVLMIILFGCESTSNLNDTDEESTSSTRVCRVALLSSDFEIAPYSYIENFEICHERELQLEEDHLNSYVYSLILVGEYDRVNEALHLSNLDELGNLTEIIEEANFL